MTSQPAPLREIWPLLFVTDIQRSLGFYRDQLGFEIVNEAENNGTLVWCRIRRGPCSLMLQQAEPEDRTSAPGVVFYFLCDDADQMHAELVSRGLQLASPTAAYYGMRQIPLSDPDGYQLCFESAVS